jgi:hypothetical protein
MGEEQDQSKNITNGNEKTVRRVNHLYKWLHPEESKAWLKGSDINNMDKKENEKKQDQYMLFPSVDEVKNTLKETRQSDFIFENAGPITNLGDQDRSLILDLLTKNNIDVSYWNKIFDKQT